MRAALGASRGALRRTLLAESLVLCVAGARARAAAGEAARGCRGPLCRALLRSRARGHGGRQRALARRGAGRAWRRCCSPTCRGSRPPIGRAALGPAGGSLRITPGTNRRLRIFATTQIACSFVLLAGAGMLVATLTALQTANTGYDMRQVLAIDVPPASVRRRRRSDGQLLPGSHAADRRAAGRGGRRVRDGRALARPSAPPTSSSSGSRGTSPRTARKARRCMLRPVSPRFFAVLGVPILAGRDFTDEDRHRHRARRHRQPERGAAAVPERRRASTDTCGSTAAPGSSSSPSRAASSASSPTWTTRTSCRSRR